ncbi:MAG: lipid-A-disaccharide synthase [Alphaproteobacteria bacterium]|nr:lipid-A-disaccharide synthase [Alphaproteobacteria bacterium]
MTEGPLIFLVAAEASADGLGARLMRALKEETGGRVRFAGVGGPAMAGEGLASLVPFGELNIMGIVEIVPHVARVLRRVRETIAAARSLSPAAVVTIDAPAFSFRVQRKLTGGPSLLVHYVAPTVWAWRPGRAKMIARFLDHLLCILPFELPYFEKVGLPASFVGHSVVEQDGVVPDGAGFRRRHRLGDAPVLCVLPGSRLGEIRRLLPVFGETVTRLVAERPSLRVVVPTVSSVAPEVKAAIASWPGAPIVVETIEEKHHAFAASTVALAASGTVNLELSVAGLPFAIAYKVSRLSYLVGRLMVKVPSIVMTNILLNRNVIAEFLQGRCRADLIAAEIGRLLDDPEARRAQAAATAEAATQLGRGGPPPSQRAARILLDLIGRRAKMAHPLGERS